MIRLNTLIPVATVNKTHGIHGELSVTVDPDVVLAEGSCVITPVEGIPVPFFIDAIRPRSADTFLITLDGVDSDRKAAAFAGATFYADPSAVRADAMPDDEDADGGFYASALIGAELHDTDGRAIGTVADIDDSTSNWLLIVDSPDGRSLMIPLASDLIKEFNPRQNLLVMDIPAGLLEMQ